MPDKKEQPLRRELRPFSMLAQIRAASVDDQKRTFDVVWSTGADVIRTDWWSGEQYIERLSMDPAHVRLGRLNNGAPFLNAHNGYDLTAVMGVVETGTAKIENGQGVASVRASKREDVAPLISDIRDGIIQNVSVGYRVYKYEVTEEMGKMPIRTAVDWEPYELSAVPMGADDGAGVRSQAVQTNPCEIVTRSTENQETNTMKTPEQLAAEQAAEQTRIANDKAAAEKAAGERAQQVERERVTGITQAVRAAKLDVAFGDKLVKDGTSLDQARAFVIDELAKQDAAVKTDSHQRIEAGQDATDKFVRGAGDWLITKAGVKEHMEKAGHKVDAGEFRGLSLLDLARMALERNGVNTRGMDKMRLVGMALTHRGAYQTLSDFAVALENTLHKVLLAAYGTTPDTWSRFCATGTVSDFRAHNRYRLGSFSRLDSLSEHGEFKNKTIPDASKELITASTKGNIIGLSRQAIINDDMGIFSRLAMMFGRAAKLSIEMDVYDLLGLNAGLGPNLNDGLSLFHANHSNISTGAALSASAIDADRVQMAQQKDPSGNEILDLRPAILLVPISLGGTARVINESQYDPDTVANKSQMKPNLVRGLFRDVVDTARLTGTRRYVFADPSVAPVIEVAFLDGQNQPFLESQDGWRVDGVEWKVRLDYAVGGIDSKGAVTNAGA